MSSAVQASGSLGAPVVKELLSQGFTVTALTRANSKSTFPVDIVVKRVEDFSSVPALTTALQGQDAVVSAVAGEAIGDQKALADAAAAAGVRRFVPSEFGFNTRTMAEDSPDLFALLGGKTRFLDYLIEKVAQNEQFSWTGASTGSFVDWTLGNGLYGIDLAARTATIYDSGDNRFQVASLPFIGKAVASVLSHPEETKNKYLAIGTNTSQNEILQILEQETAQKWKVEHAQTADLVTAGRVAL
ncbi:hypothetical protein TruAng_010915 [Truncatella angustata]|nr:hypothetical protein TruAng_010915 [Truncatella angustata]